MVIKSNTLDYLFLQDGKNGTPGKDAPSMYTWVKYSKNPDGSDLTDDPDGAVYIGFAYNKTSENESEVPSDYKWSKILGDDAYTIILSNENITFSTNQSRVPLSAQTQTCEVTVMLGVAVVDFEIGKISAATGITTSVSEHTITLSVSSSAAIGNDTGSITVPIIVDGHTFNKLITYSVAKAGVDGASGISVTSVDVQYYLSTSSTTLSGGTWTTDPPPWEDGKYYWTKTVTTLSNKSTSETDPVCITGGKGNTGSQGPVGTGVDSIAEEYAISSSKTVAPASSEFSPTRPPWSAGKYIWTRSKITYKNPTSIQYTTPVCDSSWEAANDVRDELKEEITTVTETVSGVSSTVDNINKQIENKVWQSDITTSINNYDGSTAKAIRDRVTAVEQDIEGITSSVSDMQTEIDTKADGTELSKLTSRVSTVEQTASGLTSTVESVQTDLSTTQKDLSSTKTDLSNTQKDLSSTKTDLSNTKTDLSDTKKSLNDTITDLGTTKTIAQQTADKFTWVVKSGTSATDFTITDRMASLTAQYINLNGLVTFTGLESSIQSKINGSVSSVVIEYASGTSATVAPTSGWSTKAPAWENGKYMWQRTTTRLTGSDSPTVTTTCISGATGATGATGGKGVDGRGITSADISYQASTNGTSAPSGSWSPTIPPVSTGQYLWTKTVFHYTSGGDTTQYSVSYMGTNGSNGAKGDPGAKGKSVTSIVPQYYLSTSSTGQSGGTWTAEQPVWESGKYIWTRDYITWSEGDPTTTTPVLAKAINGANSTAASAQSTANTAKSTADTAKSTAEEATKTANSAKTTAESADKAIAAWCYQNDRTIIDGAKLYTGTVTADKLNVNSLSAIAADLGTVTAGTIQSTSYSYSSGVYSVSGMQIGLGTTGYIRSKNFGIDASGNAYFKGTGTFNGAITATSLTLGTGVTIAAGSVTGLSTVAKTGSYNDLSNKPTIPSLEGYIHTDGTIGSTPKDGSTGFVVAADGALTASNAIIYGSIYASGGIIGGCKINGGKLEVADANILSGLDAAKITTGTLTSSGYTDASGNFSSKGTKFDLSNGVIKSPHFGISSNGDAYFSGTINAGVIQSPTYSYTSGVYSDSGLQIGLSGNGYIRAKNFAIDGSGNAYIRGNIDATTITVYNELKMYGTVWGNNAASAVSVMRTTKDGGESTLEIGNAGYFMDLYADMAFLFYATTEKEIVFSINSVNTWCASLFDAKGRIKTYSLTNGTRWMDGMILTNAAIAIANKNSTGGYHPIIAGQTMDDHVWNLGTFQNSFGFYGFKSTRTTNGTDFSLAINLADNTVYCSGAFGAPSFTEGGTALSSKYMPIRPASIELSYSTPFIDFHYNNSTADYTARIIANAENRLAIYASDGITVTGSISTDANFVMGNAHYLRAKSSNGTQMPLIGMSGSNNIWIGDYNFSVVATDCYIVAKNIYKKLSGSQTALSDERFKTNISDISNAEDFIMSLVPKKYKFTDGTSGRYHCGFLANQVKDSMNSSIGDFGVFVRYTFDEDVPIDPDNPDTYICGLRYEELIAPHIKVTQTHHKEIAELKERIAQLEAQLNQVINNQLKAAQV